MLLSSIELTVSTTDFDDINVFAFKRERPKSQTWMNKVDIRKKELNQHHHMKQKLKPKKHAYTVEDVNQSEQHHHHKKMGEKTAYLVLKRRH